MIAGNGPLWDWIKRKTKNRDSVATAQRFWPTEKSVGAMFRTMPMWSDVRKKKFNAMIQALNLGEDK